MVPTEYPRWFGSTTYQRNTKAGGASVFKSLFRMLSNIHIFEREHNSGKKGLAGMVWYGTIPGRWRAFLITLCC